MLSRMTLWGALGLAVMLAGTGCSGKTAQQRDSLAQQNKAMSEQLAAERARADAAEARANASVTKATEPTPDSTPVTPDMSDATPAMPSRPEKTTNLGGGVSRGHNASGEDVIRVSSDVLFDSGRATLKPAAKRALDKAVAILKKEYNGRQIRVEGYTDPTPVKKTTWDDNWDLGAARARAVMLYLGEKGVHNMYIASFGATKLKSTKNLAENRRVEIVVVRGGK